MCWVPAPLADAALVNAVVTATEAKAQALLEAGVPGTGTASDAIVVCCPPGGTEAYGGPRSAWGARLARAVHGAVPPGVERHGPAVITLVLGGARSGKSAVAERLAARAPGRSPTSPRPGVDAGDPDHGARIEAHRARRPPSWATVEAGPDLRRAPADVPGPVLVDSLGTWVTARPLEPEPSIVAGLRRGPAARLLGRGGDTVVVSEEVGLGVHPSTELGRRFRDVLGEVNQAVAEVADGSLLVVAGRVLPLERPPDAGRREAPPSHSSPSLGGAAPPDRRHVRWFPVVGARARAGRRRRVVGRRRSSGRRRWPPAVVVAADLALTGMLHVDGLADTADGLLPHLERERRLEVMAEPAVGAFAVAVVGVVLLAPVVGARVDGARRRWLVAGCGARPHGDGRRRPAPCRTPAAAGWRRPFPAPGRRRRSPASASARRCSSPRADGLAARRRRRRAASPAPAWSPSAAAARRVHRRRARRGRHGRRDGGAPGGGGPMVSRSTRRARRRHRRRPAARRAARRSSTRWRVRAGDAVRSSARSTPTAGAPASSTPPSASAVGLAAGRCARRRPRPPTWPSPGVPRRGGDRRRRRARRRRPRRAPGRCCPALVGRDPSGLDEDEMARAVVESVAENTVDAVVAPALWAAVAGRPGALGYRAVNTLDAMVGHRSDRYDRFGWAAPGSTTWPTGCPARATAALVAAVPARAAAGEVWRRAPRRAGPPVAQRRRGRGRLRRRPRAAPRRREPLRRPCRAAARARRRPAAEPADIAPGRAPRLATSALHPRRRPRCAVPGGLGPGSASGRRHAGGDRDPLIACPPGCPRRATAPPVAAALGHRPGDVLDLSASLNPFAPDAAPSSPATSTRLGRYPDPDAATAALAAAIGVDPDRLAAHQRRQPRPSPSWPPTSAGGVAAEPDFRLHPAAGRAGPLWRRNPHNPTGVLAAAATSPSRRVGRGVLPAGHRPLDPGRRRRAWSSGSLTKLLACPGLRVGYVLAPTTPVASCAAASRPGRSNGLALRALPDLLATVDLPAGPRAVAALRRELVDAARCRTASVGRRRRRPLGARPGARPPRAAWPPRHPGAGLRQLRPARHVRIAVPGPTAGLGPASRTVLSCGAR